MRFMAFAESEAHGLAVASDEGHFRGRLVEGSGLSLQTALAHGADGLRALAAALVDGETVDPETVTVLPPLASPGKILCIGLNYDDHTAESGLAQPPYPTIFARFSSNIIGHGTPILRPIASDQLDFEGELVAVVDRGGRHIPEHSALAHVAGYSIFNDGSIRDFQTRTPQWTLGKNFDDTGAFGPVFVTADALPPGARGLTIETRLNGAVMQSASTSDLVFDVAALISHISKALSLKAGDIIVTGTPSGVGAVRKPPIFIKPGDVCEIEIESIGVLRNPVAQEEAQTRAA